MTTLTGMILAAGFGTRLRPLTLELPKPLVPVGDRTVLANAADNLRALGVLRAVVNTHHLADRYDAETLREELAIDIHLNHETRILGTAGGIAGARAHLAGDVVVHNGDILADLDTDALLAVHRERDALATLAVIGGGAPGEGPVGLDARGDIVRLRQEHFGGAAETEGAQFIGVHIVGAALVARLPTEGCMVGDVYMPALRAGEGIVAAKVVRQFTDVGTPAGYLAANRAWLGARSQFVGAGANVGAKVELIDTIVGAGAVVTGRGTIERSVIWPGAHAVAPLCDSIVTTGGKVVQETAPGSK